MSKEMPSRMIPLLIDLSMIGFSMPQVSGKGWGNFFASFNNSSSAFAETCFSPLHLGRKAHNATASLAVGKPFHAED